MSKHTKLIAMQNDLGLGHKGDIVLTTQKRIDSNQEPIAKDIIHRDFAVDFVRRWNAFEDGGLVDKLRTACEAWGKVESEMKDKNPCPDLALRAQYRKEAVKLTEAALAKS